MSIGEEVGWATEQVLMLWGRENSLCCAGELNPDSSAIQLVDRCYTD
jgi:hypothetical protein